MPPPTKVMVPAEGSISASTSTKVSGSGCASGISSSVRLAAWMPAIRAVPSTSPFGASPRATIAAVSGLMRTTARARARRSLSAFPPTSTMRARPALSRWLSCGTSPTGQPYRVPAERRPEHCGDFSSSWREKAPQLKSGRRLSATTRSRDQVAYSAYGDDQAHPAPAGRGSIMRLTGAGFIWSHRPAAHGFPSPHQSMDQLRASGCRVGVGSEWNGRRSKEALRRPDHRLLCEEDRRPSCRKGKTVQARRTQDRVDEERRSRGTRTPRRAWRSGAER